MTSHPPEAGDLRAISALLSAALAWANHSAGEGLCAIDPAIKDPEDFLYDYVTATGDEDYDTFADRIPAKLLALSPAPSQGDVERVARALYEEDDPWHKAWPWPNLNPEAQGGQGAADAYRSLASAAIAAMPVSAGGAEERAAIVNFLRTGIRRSQPVMDPVWTFGFNSAIDYCAREIELESHLSADDGKEGR